MQNDNPKEERVKEERVIDIMSNINDTICSIKEKLGISNLKEECAQPSQNTVSFLIAKLKDCAEDLRDISEVVNRL